MPAAASTGSEQRERTIIVVAEPDRFGPLLFEAVVSVALSRSAELLVQCDVPVPLQRGDKQRVTTQANAFGQRPLRLSQPGQCGLSRPQQLL